MAVFLLTTYHSFKYIADSFENIHFLIFKRSPTENYTTNDQATADDLQW